LKYGGSIEWTSLHDKALASEFMGSLLCGYENVKIAVIEQEQEEEEQSKKF
jgi:hypothetical protein